MRILRPAFSLILAAGLLTGGCMQEQSDSQIKEVLPRAEDIQIKLPDNTTGTQNQMLGQVADYYVLTRNVTRTLNAGAAWVLILVHTVVDFPATTVDGNVYTWGPWEGSALDPAEWKLVVTANDDGTYDWDFEGRAKSNPDGDFIKVITGHAVPGADPARGSGDFYVDFDAGELVDPIDNTPDTGNISVTYDLENRDGTAATVTMHAEGVDSLDNPSSFDYLYDENQDGSGDFQFALNADLQNNGSAAEDAVVRSRWQADSAGRSDALLSGGDLGTTNVAASECWDTGFRRVYYSDSQEWQPTEGDEGSCAFTEDMPDM